MNELTIGDKIYVSSKRAAEITGYAKDYVGQLCREGHVEAKMVGRSWYVLESSIREHRFGKQEEEIEPEATFEAPVAPEVSMPATWEPPTYTAETVNTIPKIVPAPKAPEPFKFEEEPALSEMQSAWKEWFDTRREPDLAPSEEEFEEQEKEIEEEETVALPIKKIEQPIRQEVRHIEPVRIHEKPVSKPRKASAGANMVITALLIVVAGASVATAAISTGYAANYLNDNAVIRFLAGTSTISK